MDEYSVYMNSKQEERSKLLGPSGANGCYRRQAFEYLGVEPPVPADTSAADMGTLFHLGWSALIRSQFDPSERAPDVEVRVEGLPRSGSADDVDFVNRVVTDLKTTKSSVYEMWEAHGPYESYWNQLELYALGLRQMYGGDWTLRIKAFNRETGRHCDYMRDADPEVGAALASKLRDRHDSLSAAAMIASVGDADVLELVEAFPREGRGPGRGMPCDWCPFISVCWPNVGDDDGFSPQSASIIGDEAAIGAYARDYMNAAAEARKLEAARKDAQAFLVGLNGSFPGPDGYDYKVAMVGGNPRDPVPDCDAMQKRLTELGERIPMRPGGFTASYPRVTRRKARS